MKATVFGAGNIGRGLVGAVLAETGYALTFIDVNSDLVKRLNETGNYSVVTEDGRTEVPIEGAIDARDETAATGAVAAADVVATAVGAPILAVVAPTLGAGLTDRKRSDVNVMACENIHPNSSALRDHVLTAVGTEAVEGVGFPDVVVDRIVPSDPNDLELFAEPTFEFVVDRERWVGAVPGTTPLVFTSHLGAYKLRKLWLVNGLHVLTAWLGLDAGHQFIHESISDEDIRSFVESASHAAAEALAASTDEFSADDVKAYADASLRRFANAELADPNERVARNPVLKLGPEERVIAPAIAAEDLGLDITGFAAGIASALALRDSAIGGVDELTARVDDGGWRSFLVDHARLDIDGRLFSAIEDYMTDKTRRTTMVTVDVLIENPSGLHARPAAEIVEQAKDIEAAVHIKKGEKVADAKSIMSVLALGANTGDTVTIVAEGRDAESAVDALRKIMQSKEH